LKSGRNDELARLLSGVVKHCRIREMGREGDVRDRLDNELCVMERGM
jgi:hypothetical protein